MNVVVTGAHGQLGQDIVKLLKKLGIKLTAYGSSDLNISSRKEVFTKIINIRPDVIINCAAYNAVDKAETEWEKAYCVNGYGPKYLAQAASKIDALLVHYSTDYIFDGLSNRPYSIIDNPSPISRYGLSKLLGEKMVLQHANSSLVLRVSWVFGMGNDNFPKKVIEWSKKSSVSVVEDQISSPTYTVDLANATWDLIKLNETGLFHVTNSGSCSRFEWASYILEKTGYKGEINRSKSTDFKTPAQRPAYSVLDSFGFKLSTEYNLPHWQDATDRFLMELGVC